MSSLSKVGTITTVMGKNKKKTQARPTTDHSAVSFTNSQLEGTCSDVGPVWRCFRITKIGSDEHSGFVFVQLFPRTVVFGDLRNSDIADHVHNLAKEVGGVCSVTYPLPGKDLEQHGLAQDGCRPAASAFYYYTSIKLDRSAVESQHNKEIKGVLCAQRLCGEGSKTKKRNFIVRNVPLKAKVDGIIEMFSAVCIPQISESGLATGFAFVKFKSRQDAEKAIQKFNGQMFAVDCAVAAVPRKIYRVGITDPDTEEGQENGDINSEDLEDDKDFDQQDPHPSADKDEDSSNSIGVDAASELNFDDEVDVAKRVLNNLFSSSVKGTVPSKNDDSDELTKEMMDLVSTGANGEYMELSDEHKQSRGVGESVENVWKFKLLQIAFDCCSALVQIIIAVEAVIKGLHEKQHLVHTGILMYAAWSLAVPVALYLQYRSIISKHVMDVENQLAAEPTSMRNELAASLVSRLDHIKIRMVLDCYYAVLLLGAFVKLPYTSRYGFVVGSMYPWMMHLLFYYCFEYLIRNHRLRDVSQ